MPPTSSVPHLLRALIALTLTLAAACADAPEPAWRIACDTETQEAQAEVCKETCGAEARCASADQRACEAECRACAPDGAWCPAE